MQTSCFEVWSMYEILKREKYWGIMRQRSGVKEEEYVTLSRHHSSNAKDEL